MTFSIARIDFSDDKKCNFCTQPLTSGKVRILRDEHGREVQAGPVCAKKHATPPTGPIPDLTTAALEPDSEVELGTGATGTRTATKTTGSAGMDADLKKQRIAVGYLLLRAEKLKHFRGMSIERITKLHEQFQTVGLTEDCYKYLSNLMAKVQKDHPAYSLRNLQAIYACSFWIDRLLQRENKAEYITSLKQYLEKRLALTPGQIEGLNKFLSREPGMLTIKPDAFAFDPSKRKMVDV